MSDNVSMEALALMDLESADALLYLAAKAYVAVAEAGFIQEASGISPDDEQFIRIGGVAAKLHDAAHRHREALERFQAAGPAGGGAA